MGLSREEVAKMFPAMAERFKPEKAEGVNAAIQFDLSGDNGGKYWLKIADGKAVSGEGDVDSPRMTIRTSADDYVALTSGELDPMQGFMKGKIKVQGDMGLAMKLMSLFT